MLERHAELLENRVRKNFRHLAKRFAEQKVDAFRVYDWDIPEVRARVDFYAGHLVVAEYERAQTRDEDGYLDGLGHAAARATGVSPENIHLKRRRTRPRKGARYERLGEGGERLMVREGEAKYWVNLDDYLDTGLFPDHRVTRAMLGREVAGKTFLNLYGYTGAFTCAAGLGGAVSTTTVDLSSRYVDWARDNLELNGLSPSLHELVVGDVRQFVEQARRERRTWDLVFIDPPSFSTVGSFHGLGGLDVQEDHSVLVDQAMALVRSGGKVVFSTNHQRFEPRFSPALRAREVTHLTVPEDFRNRTVHRCFFIDK